MPFRHSFVALLFACSLATAVADEAQGVDIYATAVNGDPYGVARVEIPLSTPVVGNPLPPLQIRDADGRVLFPIARDMRVPVAQRPSERPVPQPGRGRLLNRVGNLIRELTNEQEQLEQTVAREVSFLFRGSKPLTIQLSDARGEIGSYEITPTDDPAARGEVLQQWWTTYTAAAKRQIDTADYPTWVETYLVAMLSGRTDMPLPDWFQFNDQAGAIDQGGDELIDALKLVGGASEASDDIFRAAAAGVQNGPEPAMLPLPDPPQWEEEYQRDQLDQVPTEPIASRVPPECFYVRYGSFSNYLWFRDLSEEYGGDITRMVSLRGIRDKAAARVENQLSLITSDMTRMLGPTVIEDQALIGRDLFLTDGATIGVVLKARNAFLLRSSLNNDRTRRAGEEANVELSQVEIAGHQVSLLRSPDNRVRSFMAEQDGYFLVTNSRTLVERFFEVGETGQSLAATPSFRLSRQFMPLDRDDTVFAYFSPEMMQRLASPEYLIELRRRLYAKADISLVHLARVASAAEGRALRGIDELREAGFLPTDFGQRPDGSGTITVGDQVLDSLRGARGVFLPIADVEIEAVTADEARWYQRIAQQYTERFPQLDPIMVGVRRDMLQQTPAVERLSVHAEISPFRPEKYGWMAEQLGPPTKMAIQFAPDDIAAVQAHVTLDRLGAPTHLFAAIKDSNPPDPDAIDGLWDSYQALQSVPGYLGAWPQPGALDRLPLGLGRGQPVGPNLNRLIGGVYRYTGGGFSILSFYPDLLRASLSHLAAIDVEDSAQIRAHVGNLVGSRLEDWVNAQLYDRAAETSVAGANFLSMMTRQLHVAPEDAQQVAEQILGGRLQCSLGGEYQYLPELGRWTSTAWGGESPPVIAPTDYVAPAMKWFRGADAAVTQYADRVVADVTIDVARQNRLLEAQQPAVEQP